NQEVQQDEDLFSTGFNLFGEPYKTNKGDALANRVQNTLGSYEEMKDLLTSHSNQSHLVGIPKGSAATNNQQQASSSSGNGEKRMASAAPSSSSAPMQPPAFTVSLSNAAPAPHQNSKKSRSSMEWSKGGHGLSTQETGKMALLEEQQLQRHEELFSSLKDELGLKEESNGCHFKSSSAAESGGPFKSSPFENEASSHLSLSSSPLASTSVLTTPTPGLTTPTSGLTTPTFPPGCLSGKPIAIQQKPTAYVRPMDGQDQAPSDSPQLKPPPVATEGYTSSQTFGGTSGNVKNKLPKLNLSHTGEVRDNVNGASGSSSESESSSESDTDESESSSSDSDYNQASRTNTPEPEPPSTNKWQLDSWLNKVQAQTKPLIPAQQEHHGTGPSTKIIPKSREFIETDSSSSSSECQSEGEEATKIPTLPPQATRSAINAHMLANTHIHAPLLPCLGSAGGAGSLGTFDMEPLSPHSNVGHDVALTPLREYHEIQSLWVKIDLSFLSRVPGQPVGERSRTGPAERDGNAGRDKERQKLVKGERQEEENDRLVKDKERQGDRDRLTDRESGSLSRKQTRRRDEKPLPPLLSPLSDEPPRKRACESGPSLAEEAGAVGMLPCSTSSTSSSSSSSHRHRRGEGKAAAHARNGSVSGPYYVNHSIILEDSSLFLFFGYWFEQASVLCSFIVVFSRVHSAEYYMQEAKRLKHKADALTDKFGKAVNYADGALSFIECGNAMERDPLEAKSPYTMYSETVELIRYAMRLKNFTSHSATVLEKRLAVLCNRCLSLLYLRMFHLKKDHAVKYSRSLMEYFKVTIERTQLDTEVNGTPSPLSLSPSPASGSSGSVAIPQRIHHMAASHVNITNNILRSYEHWETADRLAGDNFFQDLDSAMEPLSQQSSMTGLVRYIRQGLHWLRTEAQLL
uniref:AF4/FMR2 family, member 2 n=1 Tax=Fundulus heteroclitus TaxID=8078 RepID=A0A3Q2TTL2_FUNHE